MIYQRNGTGVPIHRWWFAETVEVRWGRLAGGASRRHQFKVNIGNECRINELVLATTSIVARKEWG